MTPRESGTSTTVYYLFQRWLRSKQLDTAPRTQRVYRCHAEKFVQRWGHLPADEITRPDLSEYRHSRAAAKVSNRTINQELTLLKQVLNWGLEAGLVTRVPKFPPRLRVKEAPVEVLTKAEFQRLLGAARKLGVVGLPEALMLGRFCALRASEARTLRWRDIDLEGSSLLLRKTKTKTRRIYIPSVVVQALQAHRPSTKLYVCELKYREPWSTRGFTLKVQQAFHSAELDTSGHTFHKLRATCATKYTGSVAAY